LDKPDLSPKFVKNDITMGAAKLLDRQINDYLVLLNTRQKKAILNVAKTFIEEKESDIWGDDEFVAELDRRTAEYESGKVKMLTLDEMESRVRKAHKAKQKK
jgi:putative addiction module component (TIGR02574 family)